MRHWILATLALLWTFHGQAWAWNEGTHQKLTGDALAPVQWLDQYQGLSPTPFDRMARDVLGKAAPVGPDAFNFKDTATREQKHRGYMDATAGMSDPTVQKVARHLLLSSKLAFPYALDEGRQPVSARQILARYSSEPDNGMDKGLDASRHQKIMGGTNPNMTSSQGFRHMSFLLGRLGEAPDRAQLFFDLGAKAIQTGHPYWGFRFVAWGLHYLEDLGTPVHTNILPTLKYIRVKGMLRPRDASGKPRLNKRFFGDLVEGSAQINANYHFLYENYVDKAYTGQGKEGQMLSAAVQGNGARAGWLRRLLAPRSIKSVGKRRAWSRLSTPSIARNAVRLFTGIFRKPAAGAPSNTVRSVNASVVKRAVADADRPLPNESQRAFDRRQTSRDVMMRRTVKQFRKNGAAVRQAMTILGKQIGAR
jgi:hypothetical protein